MISVKWYTNILMKLLSNLQIIFILIFAVINFINYLIKEIMIMSMNSIFEVFVMS